MDIEIRQPDLARIVGFAARGVAKSSAQPINHHILLSVDPEARTLAATGTDLSIWCSQTIPLMESLVPLEPAGNPDDVDAYAMTVGGKVFASFVSSLPSSAMIRLSREEGASKIDLVAPGIKTTFGSLSAEMFAGMPDLEAPAVATMSGNRLARQLRFCLPCLSTDATKPNITGVYLMIDSDSRFECIGTDTHTLALRTIKVDTISLKSSASATWAASAILPPRAATEFAAIAEAAGDATVTLSISLGAVRLEWETDGGKACAQSRVIDHQYPNCRRVIPTNGDITYTVPRDVLTATLKRCLICLDGASMFPRATFTYGEGNLTISVGSDKNKYEETIPVTGPFAPFIAYASASFCQRIVNIGNSDGLSFTYTAPIRPCLVKSTGASNDDAVESLHVLMPMSAPTADEANAIGGPNK